MTNFFAKPSSLQPRPTWLILLIIPILYGATLAQTLVLGDPTEYTFVAHILGIAHPPGYAFITLMGKLFQTLIPFGPIPWRMHLLAATSATLAAFFVYGTIRTLAQTAAPSAAVPAALAALFAAFTVATATNHWQHAIHTNPHIMTATFLAANVWLLTKWAAAAPPSSNKWLYFFCLSAGLGVTHHPLTVFAFPAYALFIGVKRPSIWREGSTLLKMIAFALLGLSLWLYFPIRSAMTPAFGPTTMNTLNGFLDHVLARGLSDSLPYYSWADQPRRALVFWSLLRLQYALPILFLTVVGIGWLWPSRHRPFLLLLGGAFAANYAFTMSLKAQDIMAYLIGPFLLIGLLAGIGLYGLLTLMQQRLHLAPKMLFLFATIFFLWGPVLQTARSAPHISLRHYTEGQDYVNSVFSFFEGQDEGAVLLNDWEHMTPLWYTRFVTEQWPDPADVRPQFVSAAYPWVESVFSYLPGGPVYLSNYRREVTEVGEDGFRLRPFAPFYQVVEPGDTSLPPYLTPFADALPQSEIEMVAYHLPQTEVTAGDYVPLTLAMRTPQGTADYYVPVLQVGQIRYPFTTDSHLITPKWKPDEIIIERFDLALPHHLAQGDYPVSVHLANLSQDWESQTHLDLGTLHVTAQAFPIRTDHLLANFRQRIGLVSAVARANGRRAAAPWDQEAPLTAQPGDTIHLTLQWQSLASAEESYTVFVHLIDPGNRPIIDTLDYTPLGGAFPTHLWIPKWLPGQRVLDPYRLSLPPDLAPGTYLIEVGLYEMVSKRRLHLADVQGNLVGDRYILGSVVVSN